MSKDTTAAVDIFYYGALHIISLRIASKTFVEAGGSVGVLPSCLLLVPTMGAPWSVLRR